MKCQVSYDLVFNTRRINIQVISQTMVKRGCEKIGLIFVLVFNTLKINIKLINHIMEKEGEKKIK